MVLLRYAQFQNFSKGQIIYQKVQLSNVFSNKYYSSLQKTITVAN